MVVIDRNRHLNTPDAKVAVLAQLRAYFPDSMMSRLASYSVYANPY